jgi:hypothetical protein
MSEPSYPRSQPSMADISVDSAGCPISQRGLSQVRNQVKHKPKFAEFACSYASVSLKPIAKVRIIPISIVTDTSLCCCRDERGNPKPFLGIRQKLQACRAPCVTQLNL